MNHPRTLRLADAEVVEAILDDMAAVMARHVTERTALVGILRRGAPLALALQERLERLTGLVIAVGELSLKRYSDELELLHQRPELDPATLDLDVADRHLILVDDVIFSGESLFRAACHLRAAGASRIQTAVLCARGQPTMPIRADFVGRRLDVGSGWIIDCHVPPYEETLGISINEQP